MYYQVKIKYRPQENEIASKETVVIPARQDFPGFLQCIKDGKMLLIPPHLIIGPIVLASSDDEL